MWIFAIITKNLSDFENRCNVVIFLLLGRTKANVKRGGGDKTGLLKGMVKTLVYIQRPGRSGHSQGGLKLTCKQQQQK